MCFPETWRTRVRTPVGIKYGPPSMPLIPENACAQRHYPTIRGSELMCDLHPTIVKLIPRFDCGLVRIKPVYYLSQMQHAMSD
jgi:hypothetical protein